MPSSRTTTRQYLNEDINFSRADVILLVLSFATGIVDVFTFSQLGVFVANMTGNVVFLGIGIAGVHDPSVHPSRSITALCCFWVGSFTTGQLAHRLGIGKRRWYLFIISLFQSIIVLISAILIYTSAITLGQPSDLALISIMSIAFGSQGAAGRLLASTPITTVVVTSAMFDLFADKDLFAPLGKNVARNQRVAFILVFFVGTIVGGATLRHVGVPFTLVLAGIFKFAAVMLFLVAPGKTRGSNMVKAEEGFANDGGPGESAQTGGSAARQEP